MNNVLKDRFFTRVFDDFKVMSLVVMKQVELVKQLMDGKTDESIYTEIYHNERILDSLDVKLRKEIVNAIVLYSPRATDLRQIMSNYDITAYVERVGDLIMNMAHFIKTMDLKGEIYLCYKENLALLFTISASMIENSIRSFSDENNALARDIIQKDDAVDQLYYNITKSSHLEFAGRVLEEQQLNDLICVNNIAYNIERIGDNATNIAEAAIFVTEGLDIKHANMKKEEEEAAAKEVAAKAAAAKTAKKDM